MNDDVKLIALVTDLIDQTRSMIRLLQEDAEYHRSNDLESMHQNNSDKMQANNKLIDTISQLAKLPVLIAGQGNIYEKLLQYVKSLPSPQRDGLEGLLFNLHDDLTQYSELLIINRHLINANMAYVKDILFAMMNHKGKEDVQPTYDRTGLLERV